MRAAEASGRGISARRAPDFWALPARGLGGTWRAVWDRWVDQVRKSDPLTLYQAVEAGVPAGTIVLISYALNEPAPKVMDMLGLPETTYRRRAEAGEVLPEVVGHRAVGLVRLVAKLRQLLSESGDPERLKEFDLEAWVSSWIKEPLPELGGKTPAELLRNPEGQRLVETLLERMRGGLVA